ncbi:MAG: hypothetical protein ANABAC_0814 [Anaerolineae bacterium]|nr:MAG: hypothetical protein ANABAC_0814 [Anaerolineae bacterium]
MFIHSYQIKPRKNTQRLPKRDLELHVCPVLLRLSAGAMVATPG